MIQAASVQQRDPNLYNGDAAMQYESKPDSLESGFGGLRRLEEDLNWPESRADAEDESLNLQDRKQV